MRDPPLRLGGVPGRLARVALRDAAPALHLCSLGEVVLRATANVIRCGSLPD
jgi:hypothetical protein